MEQSPALSKAKASVDSFSLWLYRKVRPFAEPRFPLDFASWRKELDLIRALVEKPTQVQIALVGTTGAGKSTFLNAVLGQEVLPVGVMHPCTAFVTAVTFSADYRVKVQYCTRAEWQEDLKSIIAALTPGEVDESGTGDGENKRLVDAAKKRVRAVYGDDELEPNQLLNRALPQEVEEVFLYGPNEAKSFDSAKEMLDFLRKLIRGESSLWPLIKQVNVSGPYDCLASGLEIIDLPGLNDPNEARVEVTREFLRTSPFVWVVFPMVRGITEDIQRILREEKLLRTLILSGSYGALSLVGTKADDIDTNIANQLGLPDDCSQEELIKTYCEQTVKEARIQLEQMVRELATHSDAGATLGRIIEIARNVKVHTTSASAYNKIKRIGHLRKDYGISNESDTGIPGVHQHLLEIGRCTGEEFNAEQAMKRLDQFANEISFFFRAKEKSPTAEVVQARSKLPQEQDKFSKEIKRVQERANDQLKTHREKFLEKMDPLFAASVQGVKQTTERWRGIHWATLRATVQRNGVFKNYSGKSFDLNEDLAEPLLQQLPVSWEKYFTDDVGGVTNEFVLRVAESGKAFCERVRLIIELLLKKEDKSIEGQLAWFQDKVSLLSQGAKNQVLTKVKERRSELAAKMPKVALARMQPAYDSAKQESGKGTKKRILDHIEPAAIASAQPIYSTIREDLLAGLTDLEIIIIGMFHNLTQAASKQACIVTDNANIDVDEASIDPDISALLKSIPASNDH